jgi:WD40 repeat protein
MRMWQRTTGVQGAERIFVRRGCRWLGVWLAWVSVLSAFGQGRPDIVWMQGGHALSITGVAYSSNAYSPNGDFIVLGSFDRTIKVWRVSDGALIRTLTGHIDYIHCVALSPDGTLIASGGRDRTVRVWRVSDGTLVRTLTGHTGNVNSVVFSPTGNLLVSGSDDRTIRVWSVSNGELIRTLTGHIASFVRPCPQPRVLAR